MLNHSLPNANNRPHRYSAPSNRLLTGPYGVIRLLLLPLLLFATLAASAQESPDAVKVHVRHGATGTWHVRYELPETVQRISFNRTTRFRANTWHIDTDGIKLKESENDVWLQSSGQSGFREIDIHFNDIARDFQQDYSPVVPFSGGGSLFFTGYLNFDTEYKHHFTLQPAAGEHLIFRGKLHTKPVEWTDTEGERGKFVYFGKQRPVASDYMLALVDSGFPSWLQGRAESLLPRLFEYYANQIDRELGYRPTVYYSYQESEDSGRSMNGGAVQKEIQMKLEGQGWTDADDELIPDLFWFVAHEAAHLWNSQLVKSAEDSTHAWMHEGGATAIAHRALLDLGIINETQYHSRFEEELNRCADNLAHAPVSEFTENDRFMAHYACGSLFNYAIEAAARQHGASASLLDFWQALLNEAAAENNQYDPELFLSTAREFTEDPSVTERIRAIVFEPTDDGQSIMRQLLVSAGVTVQPVLDGIPDEPQRNLAKRVVSALLSQDCEARYSYSEVDSGVRIKGVPGCTTLEPDRMYPVTKIMGKKIWDEGAELYDAVRRHCASGETVDLELEDADDQLMLACPDNLPERRPWLKIMPPA